MEKLVQPTPAAIPPTAPPVPGEAKGDVTIRKVPPARPKQISQAGEDSFPASDAPSWSPTTVGTPEK